MASKSGRGKFGIDFQDCLDLGAMIDELAGKETVTRAVENALVETDKYVTAEVDKAVAKSKYNFNRTGKTKKSIDRDTTVEWEGSRAYAKAGFNISDGGLPSIFLMYGVPSGSGDKIKPDTNLKNAVLGKGKHKKKIEEIQQAEFNKVISEVMKE